MWNSPKKRRDIWGHRMERRIERYCISRTQVFWTSKAAKTTNFQALIYDVPKLSFSDLFCLLYFTWSSSCIPDWKQLQGRNYLSYPTFESSAPKPMPFVACAPYIFVKWRHGWSVTLNCRICDLCCKAFLDLVAGAKVFISWKSL